MKYFIEAAISFWISTLCVGAFVILPAYGLIYLAMRFLGATQCTPVQ